MSRYISETVLFPVILSDLNYPKLPIFDILYRLSYLRILSGVRDFKFGRYIDGSKCLPADGKPSLKGAWLGHANHLKFGGHQP